MFNNPRILIILLIFSLGLSSYILFSLNKIDVQNEDDIYVKIANSKVDMKKVEENYEQNLQFLIKEIRDYVSSAQEDQNYNLEELKNKISDLRSPGNEYKKIHLDLILSLTNLEKYFEFGDENEREKSLALLDDASQEYLKISKEKENGI
jgi:50S ribosomal subunit-associated GTPase HflX